ncbi:MAG TPA: neutral/alkaline non-lysosomal ceramidase N-terminal domain-containing protein [Chitinophagaceae bacterium]|nr:neutral/alkaline non-lysosomal ceramidase N-terminal domain-containing protein [Chitinophagaceae bacterium]
MKYFFLAFTMLSLSASAQDLKIGASQAPINPPIPSYIAGHTKNRKFTAIHDSLYVKALVADDGKHSMAILSFDCIGLLYPQLQEIRTGVQKRLKGFMYNQIVMSSTHTHAGPDVVGLWGPDLMHTGVDSSYIKFLVNTAVDQVVKAWKTRKKVKASFNTGTYGEEWVRNISEPEELDRSLTTIQFKDSQGRSVATLTNFACHPTFLDAVHQVVSADYPAGFYRHMDATIGGVNIFLQGSIGGWVQPEGEPQTIEQAYRRGRELGNATLQLLQNARTIEGSAIKFNNLVFEMPIKNEGFIQLAKAGVIKRNIDTSATTEIALFSIGNAMFATHPGETVPQMSLETKKLMNTMGPKMVLGLSMDAMGYIVKPYFFDKEKNIPHAEYLCSMSAGPDTMNKVMEVLRQLAVSSEQ